MDNQHKHIKGYRDLSQSEIDLMNRIKAHAELTRLLVLDVIEAVSPQPIMLQPAEDVMANSIAALFPGEKVMELVAGEALLETGGHRAGPCRWVDLADDHLQQGFMALTRAVAQPTSY